MATYTAYIGSAGSTINFGSAYSIGINIPSTEYVTGICFTTLKDGGGAYWRNNRLNSTTTKELYFSDSSGTHLEKIFDITIPADSSQLTPNDKTGLTSTAVNGNLYLIGYEPTSPTGSNYIVLRNQCLVTVTTASRTHKITVSQTSGGTISANKQYAVSGETVTLSATPDTGYSFSSWNVPGVTVTGNKFVMPACDVTVSAAWTHNTYSITLTQTTGGTISSNKASAYYGDTISLTATPSTGYSFNSWNSSGPSIANNSFTMPAANVTISASWTHLTYSVVITQTTGGTVTANKTTAYYDETITLTASPSTGYTFSSWSVTGATISGNSFAMPEGTVYVNANWAHTSYTVTVTQTTGGSISASKTSAYAGDTITMTASPDTGYSFSAWSITGAAISGNKFTMPAGNVTLSASFTQNAYSITLTSTHPEASTISYSPSGNQPMGTTISLSQTLLPPYNRGFIFRGWTSDDVTITGSMLSGYSFVMPAKNVTVQALYVRISRGTVTSSTFEAGVPNVLTIVQVYDQSYDYAYRLDFGNGITTGIINITHGIRAVSITAPLSWANNIPSSTMITGGKLYLYTYSNGHQTLYGSNVINNLTYVIPENIVPSVGSVTAAVLRTVGGITYANVGNYYVQNHAGVTVTLGTCSGSYGSTITKVRIKIGSYSGSAYDQEFSSSSATKNSGLLSAAGTCDIVCTATDSRGRTNSRTVSITVTAYDMPAITSFDVWRVNASGVRDSFGTLGMYSMSSTYTAIGSNTKTVTMRSQGVTKTNPANSGWIFHDAHQTFNILNVYDVKLTVSDAFETVESTIQIPSAAFILHFSSDGTSVAFGQVVEHATPTGYTGTFEISDSMQIFYGNMTLRQYIQSVIDGTI